MNYYLQVVILLLCINSGCVNETTTVTHTTVSMENEAIKKEYRDEINLLNELIIEAIIDNDISSIDSLRSDLMKDQNQDEYEQAFLLLNDQLIDRPHSIFKECWVKRNQKEVIHEITGDFIRGELIDSAFYDIAYISPQKESYLSILKIKTAHCERLLTFIYGRYRDKWMLDYMAIGNLKIQNLTSPEHLKQAEKFYEEGKLTQALTSIFASQYCSAPINNLLTFKDNIGNDVISDEIVGAFSEKYQFPLDMTQIGLSNELISFTMVGGKSGEFFPFIAYLTKVPLDEVENIRDENVMIHSKIEEVLPGIKEGYNGIVYGVYNENPELVPAADTYNLLRDNE